MLSSHPTFSQQKADLRREMKAKRAAITPAQHSEAAEGGARLLGEWLQKNSVKNRQDFLAVYLSRPSELSLDIFITHCMSEGWRLCAPRVDLETNRMSFWQLDSLEAIEVGPWSVRQPVPLHQVESPAIVFVPGLAFDASGHRLGMGGGWYDRFLRPGMIKVGIGFDCQIVPQVPIESHDFRMDWVVSEQRVIQCKI